MCILLTLPVKHAAGFYSECPENLDDIFVDVQQQMKQTESSKEVQLPSFEGENDAILIANLFSNPAPDVHKMTTPKKL